jgi:hypothetical protein
MRELEKQNPVSGLANAITAAVTLAVLTYGLGLLRTGGDVTLPEGGALVAHVVD